MIFCSTRPGLTYFILIVMVGLTLFVPVWASNSNRSFYAPQVNSLQGSTNYAGNLTVQTTTVNSLSNVLTSALTFSSRFSYPPATRSGLTSNELTSSSTACPSGEMAVASCHRQSWIWLWENYENGLQMISHYKAAISVVSPNTYYLFDNGTFGVQSQQAEGVCSQVQSMGLKCEPLIQNNQTSPAGINSLLTSVSLQSSFIHGAVTTALESKIDGYNVDFEPSSGTLNVSSDFGAFLAEFASAMHSHGLFLSVDVASWNGAGEPAGSAADLWNFRIESHSGVDLILTMQTYDTNTGEFQSDLTTILQSVPSSQLAVGLLTQSQNDAYLVSELSVAAQAKIGCVMVWPSYGGFLTNVYWGNLTSFMT